MRTHTKNRLAVRCRQAGAATVATATALVTLTALAPVAQAADSGTVPSYLSTFGGPGRAEVYPSGLETTPDGGVVLADTGNDRVVKYNAAGERAWSHGVHGFGDQGINNPRDVGVDATGNVYVADTGNTSIVKLSPTGTFLGRYRGPAGDQIKSPIGITVANGEVIVADAGSLKIRIFSLAGTQLRTVSQPASGCTFSQLRDVTADSAGNLYVANYTRNNVLKLAPNGSCTATFGSVGTTDGKFKNPYGVAVAHDPVRDEDLLYVADSNNNRVQVLTLDGEFVGKLGDHGGFETPGTFSQLRRVAVDANGNVWGADLWGFSAQRFDRTAGGWSFAERIGDTEPGETEDALFNQPNGITTDEAGNVYVMDRMHHRFTRFDRQGRLLSICGDRGTVGVGFNWPADLAIDDQTGNVWLVDTHQNRLQVVTPDCATATPVGTNGAGLNQFTFPSGIEIRDSDRVAFVADSSNNRLVSYNVATRAPIAAATNLALKNPQGVAVDPVSGDVFVADKANNRVVRASSLNGSTFTSVQSYTGLNKPEGVTVDDAGRLIVANTGASNIKVLDMGTGAVLGTMDGPDGLFEPQSVHFADDVLYVSDTFNDRVQTYAWAGDPVAPTIALTAPAADASLPSGTVALEGTARDNVDIEAVEVAVRDTATDQWWNPTAGAWETAPTWSAAALDGSGRDRGWDATFAEPSSSGSGSYEARARAVDGEGNTSSDVAAVDFTVEAGNQTDATPPTAQVTSPAADAVVPTGPVTVSGTAADDVAVARVEVAIRDRIRQLWWNPTTGAFQTNLVRVDATLSNPGGRSTGWTHVFDAPAAAAAEGSGEYLANVRAVDGTGKFTSPSALTNWTTQSGSPAPETTVTAPAAGASLPNANVALAGQATDDAGVAEVEWVVRDTVTNKYWNPGTRLFVTTTPWRKATLSNVGQPSTGWTASFAAPAAKTAGGSGSYEVRARAVDSADQDDPTPAVSAFTVTGVVDTVAPETTVTSPANNSLQPKPVSIAGQATDAVGVAKVQVHVKDRDATNQYWNPTTGAWQTGILWFDATVTSPGATSTGWSASFSPPATTGRYWVAARAVDGAGNRDISPAGVNFQVANARKLTYVDDFAGPGLAEMTPVDVLATPTHYYVLDVARYRIVRVDRATGEIDDQVGGGRGNLPGELAAARSIARASNGDIYIADTPNNRVSVYSSDLTYKFQFGSKGTGATQFTQVYGLAIGQGQGASGMQELVYTVDGDGRIKKWNLDGTYIGAFGAGVPLNQPRMAEIHPVTNDLWVVNARDRQVVAISPAGAEVERFGQGGTADGRFMGDPRGLAINANGTRAYVSDEGNHRIQVFDAVDGPNRGQHVMNIAPADTTDDHFVDVRGIDVASDGTLVASDEWDFALKEFNSATGVPAGRSPLFGADAPLGGVNTPRGLDLDSNGRVFVSDWWNQRIQSWTSSGTQPDEFGYRGTVDDPGSINFAWDVAIQPGTNHVFVANRESHEIEVFENDGDFLTRWGTRGTTDGRFQFPQGLDFMPDGDLVVADSANNRIQRFAIAANGIGTWEATYGSAGTGAGQFSQPTGISVAQDGTIWVADTDNDRIQKRNPTTGAWTAYAKPTGGALNYRRPWGVTANPDGTVWVTDSGRGRVVLITSNGAQELEANGNDMGAGALNQPFDTLVLPSGNLLISDAFNNRIIEVRQ